MLFGKMLVKHKKNHSLLWKALILRHRLQMRLPGEIRCIRPEALQVRMQSFKVEPVHVRGDVGARRAEAVVSLPVHPLVLHAAPPALDKDVVAPGTAFMHAQLATCGQDDAGELLGSEIDEAASPIGM